MLPDLSLKYERHAVAWFRWKLRNYFANFQAKLTGLEVHTGMGLLITISLDKTIKVIRLSSMEEVSLIMAGSRKNTRDFEMISEHFLSEEISNRNTFSTVTHLTQ